MDKGLIRALLLAPSAYPLGGVATWLDHLVPGLRDRGFAVRLGLLAGAHHDVVEYLGRHPEADSLAIANPTGSREGRVRALRKALVATRPDLVLSFNVADVERAVAEYRKARGANTRLVVTQHALQPDFFSHLRARRSIVDGVVCTNRLSCRLAVRYAGCEDRRVHYAPYGVAMEGGGSPVPEVAPRLRIAWAGRFDREQKRVQDLPAICSALERSGVGFELAIAGAGPAEQELRSGLERWTARGVVRFAGLLGPEELRDSLYRCSDVLLVTSTWETGPIVAWEAAASGLGVVTSDFLGRVQEAALVAGRTAWVFPVGNAERAASELASSRSAAERAARAGALRDVVRERYSLGTAVDAWAAGLSATLELAPRQSAGWRERSPAAGRLDRILGVRRGERARAFLGIRHPQAAPGDEWPHAYGDADDPEFFRLAREMESAPAGDVGP